MTLLVLAIVLIVGMPFIGIEIMSEPSNFVLGLVVTIIGFIIWMLIFG